MPTNATVPIADIDTTKNLRHDIGDITELAASIGEHGVLEPVILVTKTRGQGYIAVAGHRRIAAATAAGRSDVPAIVHDAKPAAERTVWMLVENLQREDLDPIDEAKGYRTLINAGYNQKRIADQVSRSKAHVSKRLRLLELPRALQNRIREGAVSIDDGYELSRLAGAGVESGRIRELAQHRHDIPNAVRHELTSLKWQRKAAERAAALADDGVTVDVAGDGQTLAWALGIDEALHTDQPCHAIQVQDRNYGDDDRLQDVAVCTDPDRHTIGGTAPLDHDGWYYRERLSDEDRAAERAAYEAERAAERETTAQRLQTVTAGLSGLSGDEVIDWLVRNAAAALVPSYVYGDWPGPGTERLLTLTGLDPDKVLGERGNLMPGAKRKLMATITSADIADLALAVAEKAVPQAARYAKPDPGPTRDLIRRLLGGDVS